MNGRKPVSQILYLVVTLFRTKPGFGFALGQEERERESKEIKTREGG